MIGILATLIEERADDMAEAAAADRNLEEQCFICETDDDQAELEVDVYICPTCLFQAVAQVQRDERDVNDPE